jgi:hypothetical protein
MVTSLGTQGGRRYRQLRSEAGPSQVRALPTGAPAATPGVTTLPSTGQGGVYLWERRRRRK